MDQQGAMAASERAQYAGAVYGSLLAASVIVGSAAEGEPPAAGELIILLICTGVVFWITHSYAQVVSHGYPAKPLTWARLRAVVKHEWPLAQASFPPAIAAAFVNALDGSNVVVAWVALSVAVASQVVWGVLAAARIRSTKCALIVSGAVNLVLGLTLVALKVAVSGH
ncbi:hypothetical protein [Nonomuraea turcica]|uniref:hypothetical protein n=1 Tax=Nonomuraea sp. G32 TaxID=3067274 RepID=UPI00273B79EF|nr:hypothetical protein [Nonomuraea sp. G32]MDP4510138.1 hypothetical protein [Nonomuraea sp. G32]